jgi:hypothetical protein
MSENYATDTDTDQPASMADNTPVSPPQKTDDGAPGPDEAPESRKELVSEWRERIKVSKQHFSAVFKKMKANQYLAAHGAERAWIDGSNYTVALLNRHISQSVSALYARDPKADAQPREKMRYSVWDGRLDTLQAAMQQAAMGDPNAVAVVQDVIQGRDQEDQAKRIGKTMEILWKYFTAEQENGFRKQLKALVRRAKVSKVGYIKLGFQRVLEPRPEVAAQIEDATTQLSATEQLLRQMQDGEDWDVQSAKAEELRLLLNQLQDQQYLVIREGPVFDFPKSVRIIIDPACFHLKTFAGARWIAHEFHLSCDQIEEIYGCKVEGYATPIEPPMEKASDMTPESITGKAPEPSLGTKYRIWEVQDKRNSQFLTICEGYPDFLKEPAEPDVKIDRFWTVFPLVFNEIESDEEIYPMSDVELLKDDQQEYNRARQGLREHRTANRPFYAAASGVFMEGDKDKIASHEAHAVIELQGMQLGQKLDELLQRFPLIGIDPNLYDVSAIYADMSRVTGTQQEDLGAATNSTATSASIVAQGRTAALTDNIDDLDEVLSDLAKGTGQLMLLEMSLDMVKNIVGPGAVWPDAPMNRQDISNDLILDIKAGSSGRPNAAAELANLEKVLPYLIQIPGTNLTPYADKIAQLADIDIEEATAEGAPSVMAMNAMMTNARNAPPQAANQNSAAPPHAQGPQGRHNAPAAAQSHGPQPGMPAPGPGTMPSTGGNG